MTTVVSQSSHSYGLNPKDMFFLAGVIGARLTEQLPDVDVESFFGRTKIDEQDTVEPTVMVLLEEQKSKSTGNGLRVNVEQVWAVLVIADTDSDNVGVLTARVLKALSGWTPDRICVPLIHVDSGFQHEYSPNFIFYFPVSFKTHFVFDTED